MQGVLKTIFMNRIPQTVELKLRYTPMILTQRPKIETSLEAYLQLKQFYSVPFEEEYVVMYLDHNKILKGIYKLPMAGLQSIQGIKMLILFKCRNINAYYTIIKYHVLDDGNSSRHISIQYIMLKQRNIKFCVYNTMIQIKCYDIISFFFQKRMCGKIKPIFFQDILVQFKTEPLIG